MRRRRAALLLLATLCVSACDQATKAVAAAYLPKTDALAFANDTLRLQYSENRGGFLNLGAELPPPWRALVFTGVVAVFLGGVLGYLLLVPAVSTAGFVGWTLVFAGGVGNLLDRVVHGYVIDFINLGVGSLRTGVFNLADVAITGGIVLLLSIARRSAPGGEHG